MNTALATIHSAIARAIAPRRHITVSEWADEHRVLSSKGSAEPGRWRTARNPALREPMDALSARSGVRDVVLMWPVQYGKTEIALNVIGYHQTELPCPIMVALPGEASREKWVAQKYGPMIESTPAVQRVLSTTGSRDSANQKFFKDYQGGVIFIEHAGSPQRLKSNSVRLLVVDELDEFASELRTGDDPVDMLKERTSAFPATGRRLFISSPGIKGASRIEAQFEASDQRRYYVPCPHCGEHQVLQWSGLMWSGDGAQVWYVCEHNGCVIEESHKPAMLASGRWVPLHPERKVRGYTINALCYPIGLGPRWADLVRDWISAQDNPAKLKTFVNSRLAETWEDPAMRSVKHHAIAERAEPYRLRHAPAGVLAITAGIDTQDDRLEVHLVGWGRGMTAWTLDYVALPGDPAGEDVWVALVDLLGRPIEHAVGALLRPEAVAIDMGGHRTEAVKAWVRRRLCSRPMAVFGAVQNNAPILGKPRLADINWRGQSDKRGVQIWQVGTVAAKHQFYALLSTDADREPAERRVHFSDELDSRFFMGVTAETYDPRKNRFIKRYARNEPLDTWVYAYAAAHHPELRLHRLTRADWDAREGRLITKEAAATTAAAPAQLPAVPARSVPPARSGNPFVKGDWGLGQR